tara:strand:+ start:260 stop:487 length:228 start_codon:yes stop_codon:yes gene_type:complete
MVGDSGSTGLVMTNAHNTNSFGAQRNSFAAQQLQAQQRERNSSLGNNEMVPKAQRTSMENMGMEQQQAQPSQQDL